MYRIALLCLMLLRVPATAQDLGEFRGTGFPPPPVPPAEATLERPPSAQPGQRPPPGVQVQSGLVSVNVENAPLGTVLHDIARQAGLSLVLQSDPGGTVTAAWSGRTVEGALDLLLMGSSLTYRRDGDVVVVAGRELPGMMTSRLVSLRHVPAGGLVERLPDNLRSLTTTRLIQEHNALLVSGPADVVSAVEAFVRQLDVTPVQVLLEVLVVEFETSDLREAGVSVLGGLSPPGVGVPEGESGWTSYSFGNGLDQSGATEVTTDGNGVTKLLNFWSDILGIRSIGRLPADFYARLRVLEQAGKAEVRSRPHIATLNGNTASISVGTSQYYILKSANPYGYGGSQATPFSQSETERFEYVQADVKLQITPWVGEDGAVTAVIQPSFTTPVGGFDPRVPPALYNWSVDTSVRLADGETFMIGGLVQERERSIQNRVPYLGRIPFLGRLFRNERREGRKSELVIFITPHVMPSGSSTGRTPADVRRLAPEGARVLERDRSVQQP